LNRNADVIIAGAGHNGLVAGLMLARAGLRTVILEEQAVIGGAVRTERPFARCPNLPTSTGAYLLGLMPPELLGDLGIHIPLLRRDPHYFLPTTADRHLLFGSDQRRLKDQFCAFFSDRDWQAHCALQAQLAQLRADLAPTWLREPLSIEDTAQRYVRPALREVFVGLCRGSVGDYLQRFDFASELVQAMYAVTDGFSGLCGTWDTPGTGMNFLVHNMCRLPGSGGTWMIVAGGMGTVTGLLAASARAHGAQIFTGREVKRIETRAGAVSGVALADGSTIAAPVVIVNADPFRMLELVDPAALPASFHARIDAYRRPGTTMKVNLALDSPPRFTCLPDSTSAFGPTIHLLPQGDGIIDALRRGFRDAMNGQLADFPTIEWYIHSTVDSGLTDERGRLSSAMFVQWAPWQPAGSSWEVEGERYARHLLSIADRFAPGTSTRVADMMVLAPPDIERHFGIRHGHIHHVDNSFGFADRLPYATPLPGLYSCSAGTHPAGSVIGCAGHNAARRVLADLGAGKGRGA